MGKTSHCVQVADATGLTHVRVAELVTEHGSHEVGMRRGGVGSWMRIRWVFLFLFKPACFGFLVLVFGFWFCFWFLVLVLLLVSGFCTSGDGVAVW